MEERDEDNPSLKPEIREPVERDAVVVSWHFLVFVTSKGHVTIDWHNDSNGYYDGRVVWNVRGFVVQAPTD